MDPKFRSVSVGLALASVLLSHAAAAVNDGFSDRTPVSGVSASVTASSVAASGNTGEPDHAGNAGTLASLWWTWTAPLTGSVTLSTQGSDFDTVLAVYTGNAVDALTAVASNDNASAGFSHSSVSFACTAGTAYAIAVDGPGTAEGNVTLALTAGVPEIVVEQSGVGLTDGTATVVFGTVNAPASVDRNFTVRNNGTGPLLGVTASVTGAGYSVNTAPASVVAAGSSTVLSVRFSPATNGAHPGALTVASNDADENPFDIALSATGVTNITGFSDNFDPALAVGRWAATDGGTVDTVAQAGGPGTTGNSLRFDGNGVRQAVTLAVNALTGGAVSFSFASGNNGANAWETADSGEEVVLEYSLDGTAWTQFGGPYQSTVWQAYSVTIPPVARTGATRFRWRQLSHSGSSLDNWALDNVSIGPPTSVPVITSPLTARGFSGLSFFYQITASQSPDSFHATGLPAGLTVNTATGLISGTTTLTGNHTVTLSAVNIVGTGTATLTLNVQVAVPAEDFKILSLGTEGAVIVDHDAFTSDDRGGIAISSSRVFVTGDSSSAAYALPTLTGGVRLNTILDGLCSDISTGALYSLGTNGVPHTSGGASVNQLLVLHPETGVPTGQAISLSSPIPLAQSTGVFSGAGRIVIHNRTNVYDIQLPSGVVIDRGPVSAAPWSASESWASWGVAEQFNGALWLAYRDRSSNDIRRMRVPDGEVEVIASFSNLGDMASWTVSPQTGRWYFHHEGGSQFGSGSEMLGTALASFDIGSPTTPPEITSPLTATAYTGAVTRYRIAALRFPTSYGATGLPAGLSIDSTSGVISGTIADADTGNYSVTISATNLAGTTTATLALTVTHALPGFEDDFDPDKDDAIWDSFGGTATADSIGQDAGPGSSGNSLRFDGAGLRYALTKPVDTRTGGAVTFLIAPGNGTVAGWDTPESGEVVRVEYSTDGGVTFTLLAPLQAWTAGWQEMVMPLPPAARTGAVQFRWMQLSHSGLLNDNWAIENVRIGPPVLAPVINSALSATAYDGLPFLYRITAANVPDSFTADGLPEWLTLDSTTGIMTGTPPETGSFEITLSATNIIGTGTALFTINVYSALSDFYDPFDPDLDDGIWQAFGGSPVADTLASASGPGSVGNSLRFNGTGARFATTIPVNTTAGGMIAFNFAAGNSTTTGWDAPESSDGVVLEYSINGVTFTQIGGPYLNSTWQTVSLAIPAAARSGATQFRWRQLFNSGAFNDNWALDDVIIGQPTAPPVITSALSVSGFTSLPFSYQITGTNVPDTFTATGLPSGLTIDTATGLISGTPSAAGSYAVTLGAANSFGGGSAVLVINLQQLVLPETFKILTLGSANPIVVDHDALTSDDRGGIAVSSSRVFITGDSATASYTLNNLTGGTSTGRVLDGLCSDLGSGDLYTLAYNGAAYASGGFINQLLPLNGTTGAVSGAPIPLAQTINVSSGGAVFSGVGRVVIYNFSRVYDILLPSGQIIDRGTLAVPSLYSSENWASWGVAEFFNGDLWLAYRDSFTGNIVRQRVSDGFKETIGTFTDLGDTANWTVSPAQGRWYLHYEGGAQFGGNSETLVSLPATFSVGAATVLPEVTSSKSLTVFANTSFFYQITGTHFPTLYGATGLPPGVSINTSSGLITGNVATEGTWPVTIAVTNAAGTRTTTLMLRVISALTEFSEDFDPEREALNWAAFGGTVTTDTIAQASGLGSTGNSLRFDGAGTRFALTRPIDTRSGGSVIFRFASGSDAASFTGWDTLDASGEQVILEYTLNGSTYTQFGGPYGGPSWQNINVPIPVAARTATTSFRWRQLSHSSDNSSDNWALDDIRVGPPAAPPVITSATSLTAYLGLPFSWPLTATNFPETFSATGLPSWLSLNTATGLLTGTPPAPGTHVLNVGATNLLGTGTATVTLSISPALPSVALFSDASYVDMSATGEAANLRTALQNLGYVVNPFTTTTDAAWAAAFASNSIVIIPELEVSILSLPAATLTVVQTELASGKGLIVAGSSGSNDEQFMNAAAGWNLTPGSTSPAAPLVKVPTVTDFPSSPATLTPLNGTYLIVSSSLPAGAHPVYTLGTETAVFRAGNIGFVAHDWNPGDDPAWRAVLGDLIRTLLPPPLPGILSATAASSVAGAPFSYQILASNSPVSFDASPLPPGLSFDPLTGILSGTVNSAAIYTISISATNAIGTTTGSLTLTVTVPAPEISATGPVGNNLTDGASTLAFAGSPGGQFTKTLTLRNSGSLPLTGIGASINGTHAADFAITAPPPATIAPGASAALSVRFTPSAAGDRTAAIHIASNDADENPFDIQLTGGAGAELPAPLPPQTGVFNGFTRGYWFTAPAAFQLTGLRVPTDASSAAQNIAVVRFAANPPVYATTTSAFTLLHITRGNATGSVIPVNIPIAAGDIIGVLGDRGGIASYAPSGSTTTILGQSVTLRRLGMQDRLATVNPAAIWSENSGSFSRVELYYRTSSVTDLNVRVTGGASLAAGSTVTTAPAAAGSYSETEFTIQNDGGADLSSLAASLTGAQSGQFSITAAPATVVPSGSVTTILVRYTPATPAATAQLLIASNDPDENPFILTLSGTQSTSSGGYAQWAADAGLTGPAAQAGATPHHDGVTNLLKFAFNLNPAGPDTRVLPVSGGTAGLPVMHLATAAGSPVLHAEYLRRTTGGVLYTPQRSHTAQPGTWVAFTSTPVISPAAPGWERVVYDEPIPAATAARVFGRVEVSLP